MSSRVAVGIVALCVLSACSNGRGSVGQPASGESPPPAAPAPTPTPTQPQPVPPAPTPTEPTPTPTPTPPPPPVPTPTPPREPEPVQWGFAGYWRGTVTAEDSDRARTGIAFVDSAGDLQLLVVRDEDDPEFVLHGNLCCVPRAEQKLGGYRYLDTREDDAEIEAERTNDALIGRLEFRRGDYEFSLRPHAAYEQALSLASLAGVYTRNVTRGPGSPWSMTLTIDARGTITGSHSNGCMFDGAATLPSDGRNLVRLNMTLSNCGGRDSSRRWNGSYRGFGVLLRDSPSPSDGTTREDTLYFSLVGPTWFGPMSVGR